MRRYPSLPALACAASLLVCLLCSTPALATIDAAIRGTVHDALLNPLAGAAVLLHDSRGATVASTATAADGTFVFNAIPFGDYTVEATSPGTSGDHRHIQVTSSEVALLDLYCLAAQEEFHIVEEVNVAPPARATGSVTTLGREMLQSLPKGEDRPITEVVTTQPGFVLDAFGNVYARGNHANIQYQVDGVPIPDSVGNLFAQALPVRLVENLEILTGGMPAEFGNRLAAVVNINTRHGTDKPEGLAAIRYGSFQTIEPSAFYSRSFGGDRFGVFAGGSYLQSQRGLDGPAVDPILHDDGRSGRVFLRLDARATASDRFELFASYAYNRFQIPLDPTAVPLDPAHPDVARPQDRFGNDAPAFVPRDTDATETEHELFVTASWVHRFGPRSQLQIAPYEKFSQGVLASDPLHALGALADPGATASDVTRRANHGGAVVHYSLHAGNHLIKAGAQLDYLDGTTDFSRYVRDDAAPAGGIDPNATGSGRDHIGALSTGVYLQDRWDRGPVGLQFGVRLDQLHVRLADGATNDQLGVSPRLGLSVSLGENLVGHVFAGINWQPPAPLDAGNAARALGVLPANMAVPYDVKAQTDAYSELGLDWRVFRRLKIGAVGWGRYAWNQLDDTAVGSTNLIANYNFERGRAVGVEGKVEVVIGSRLSAFGNVSWERAEGQGIASARYLFSPDQLANPAWQTLDHVQALTANLGATLREGGAALTVLMNYGSGLRTGPGNNQTVPDHVRFDTTLQYAFDKLPRRPRVAIDLINLFDSHYAFRIANGFVGSSWAPPRSAFVRLEIPLTR